MSKKLRVTGFGFAIPSSATIAGIVVEVKASVLLGGIIYLSAALRKAAGQGGNQSTRLVTESFIYWAFGGSGDLWGATWTPADINNASFGCDVWLPMAEIQRSVHVDHIRITVYYTDPPAVTGVSPSSGPAAGGTDVTVTGTKFTGATSVKFGATLATNVVVVNDTTITCKSPAGTEGTTVDVTVTTPEGTSAASANSKFAYTATVSITGISPASGTREGGTSVTLTGTGFSGTPGVTFGGAAATGVVVGGGGTTITCTTPAHAAGVVSVVVTVSGVGTATLVNGYTYLGKTHSVSLAGAVGASWSGSLSAPRCDDNVVRLVKGGVVVGDNKAKANNWPYADTVAEYGGDTDLWGTTWTPADVNAADFGVVLSSVIDAGFAEVDHVQVQVFYQEQGAQDPTSMLGTIKVASDRRTVTPQFYQLPRSTMTFANDPNVDRAADGKTLWSARYFQPHRHLRKLWREVEFWLDYAPATPNTPGFQVWARVDEGAEFQLLDATGAAATIKAAGPQRLFFPRDKTGYYVQLILKVPAKGVTEQPVEVQVRDIVLRLSWRPRTGDRYPMVLVLGDGVFEDRTSQGTSLPRQKEVLKQLASDAKGAVEFKGPDGSEMYVVVESVHFKEVMFREAKQPTWVAILMVREVPYA